MLYQSVIEPRLVSRSVDDLVLLDGAMGTELRVRGAKNVDSDDVWLTREIYDSPTLVMEVVRDYVRVPCDVVTAPRASPSRS